jgi:hypothetical protein
MYLGWIIQRGFNNFYAEIWKNDPNTASNGGWVQLTGQRISASSGTLVFDVENVVTASVPTTSLALYLNGSPVTSAYDSTPALQTAGYAGIRSWAFRPTMSSFNAYQLSAYGYDDLPTPPSYNTFSTPFTSAGTVSPYIDDHLTGRVGNMTVNYGTNQVTTNANGYSLTSLNSGPFTYGGWSERAARVQAAVDLSAVAANVIGAAGFATNYLGTNLSNTVYGWVASRNGSLVLEIHTLDPGDGDDTLAESPLFSNSDTVGTLTFTEVGNYYTLTYVPANADPAVTITGADYHSSALGPGEVGIIGYGKGAVVGGNTAGTAFRASVPLPSTFASLPYTDLNATRDNFFDNSSEWISQLGNLVHGTRAVQAQTPGDSEEGVLGTSIATLNTGALVLNSRQSVVVDLSQASGPGGALGGVISRYQGPSDRQMYLGAFVLRGGAANIEIDANVNGTWYQPTTGNAIASASLPAGETSGTVDLTVSGSSLTLSFYNDNLGLYTPGSPLTIMGIDTRIATPGLLGLRTFGTGVILSNYNATS